jgi:hypothetical protein
MNRRLTSRSEEETYNPMDGVANLADVMLCLAVGIMLALVVNMKIDIGSWAYKDDSQSSVDTENALVIEEENLEAVEDDAAPVDDESMQRLGTVYYDEASGKYYIVNENIG